MTFRSAVLQVTGITVACIVGGLVVGVAVGAVIHALTAPFPEVVRTGVAAVIAVGAFSASAAQWGRRLARLAGWADPSRVGRFTGWIVGPTFVTIGLILSGIEPVVVAHGATVGLAIHNVYTLAFVPAALVAAAMGGLALGLGARDPRLAQALAVRAGFAAAGAFLLVDLTMDAIGWRIGAPNAAARATMLVVTACSAAAAALAAGIAIASSVAADAPAISSPPV